MAGTKTSTLLSRFLADYGMLFVLVLLCAYYSAVTWSVQHPTGAAAGEQVAREIIGQFGEQARALAVAPSNQEGAEFASALREYLPEAVVVQGEPSDARRALQARADKGERLDAIACTSTTAGWAVFDDFDRKFPSLAGARIVTPHSYYSPNFLKADNLLNVANQIAIIAIIAVGMTMVIITGGIDLSVGSLVALSAVVCARLIRDLAGAQSAGVDGMVLGCLGGIAACALIGAFSGLMITRCGIPPFIVTLAMMLVARGLARILAEGQTIYQVPASFVWLNRGRPVLGLPNAVVLMAVLYVVAHILMKQTILGRYIYAVGGNVEAARLSGVPVRRLLLFVYTLCGALAGLSGVLMASRHTAGDPNFGQMDELTAIAAVVVGGTSLQGGQGKVFGTLIGAFIIAVIQNGMNLTGVESYTQMVVLGLVILGAVLLDKFRLRGWQWLTPAPRRESP